MEFNVHDRIVRFIAAACGSLSAFVAVASVIVGSAVLSGAGVGAQPAFPVGSFAVADEDGTIWEMDAQGAVRSIARVTAPAWGLDFDAAGNLIVGGRGGIWRIDRNGVVASVVVGFHVYNIGDVEVGPTGTIYSSSMGNNFIIAWSATGQLIDVITVTGSTRSWGMGIDPATGLLFIVADGGIYRYDPATKTLTQIFVAGPQNFLQGGEWSALGQFVFADESTRRIHEIDATGTLTTVYAGVPFGDVGEGITIDAFGNYVFTDDGAITGTPTNRIFALQPGAPAALTTLRAGGPWGDVNGIAAAPGIVLPTTPATVRVGQTATIGVLAIDGALESYVFATALSATNGLPLPGGRRFPLDPDPIFFASVGGSVPGVFAGFQGALSVAGSTSISIRVPNLPALAGLDLHTAGVTLRPSAPGGIHLVSPVAKTSIIL